MELLVHPACGVMLQRTLPGALYSPRLMSRRKPQSGCLCEAKVWDDAVGPNLEFSADRVESPRDEVPPRRSDALQVRAFWVAGMSLLPRELQRASLGLKARSSSRANPALHPRHGFHHAAIRCESRVADPLMKGFTQQRSTVIEQTGADDEQKGG